MNDIEAIRQRQARRKRSGELCVYKVSECIFDELWICVTHRDPEDTEADIDALLAEVDRLHIELSAREEDAGEMAAEIARTSE